MNSIKDVKEEILKANKIGLSFHASPDGDATGSALGLLNGLPLSHKRMTVFFNFFKISATKHQLVYRYGTRKGNLTFFENRSSNQGFHSLYGVKEEKFWKNVGNSRWVDSVMWKKTKYLQFVFKQVLAVECWCEKKKIFSFST